MRLTLGIFLLSAQLLLPAVQAAGMRASASGTTSAAKKKSSSGSGQLQEQEQEAGTATTRSKHLKKKSENHNQKEPNPANPGDDPIYNPWRIPTPGINNCDVPCCHNQNECVVISVIFVGFVAILVLGTACCMWVNKRGWFAEREQARAEQARTSRPRSHGHDI